MPALSCDVAILGGGFAGSILALVLAKLGRSVIVLERGRHPRFAIGESSTPLANLALEQLALRYDLPALLPLTKFGTWQRHYPHLACGLKRGFSYFRQETGQPFVPRDDRSNELLVAASPADEVSDTHWFREHVDHFLVQQVQSAGIGYFDLCEVTALERPDRWHLHAQREGQSLELRAELLVDASGPGGVLAGLLDIPCDPVGLRTHSWSIYSHFTGVEPWQSIYTSAGGQAEPHPFACDDAALHHVCDEGWMWLLRFNNGITSAGFALNAERLAVDATTPVELLWQQLLARHPSVAQQFRAAQAVRPLVRTDRLQRRARQVVGSGWAMLAHAAYFLDPLFSPGIAHTLATVERLAAIVERHWRADSLDAALKQYATALQEEIDHVDRLIHGCYRSFGRFGLFTAFAMFYFAGAIESEERRRGKRPGSAEGFLLAHEVAFRERVTRRYAELLALLAGPADSTAEAHFVAGVADDIAPWNSAGLCDAGRCNLYPYIASAETLTHSPLQSASPR